MVPTLPPETNAVIDKLVDMYSPPAIGDNNLLELATKTAFVPLVLYAPFYSKPSKELPALIEGDIDFDAPLERQIKAHHIVGRQSYTVGIGDAGTIKLPSFLQQAFDLYRPEQAFQLPDDDNVDEHYFTLMHDECYLGKDLTARECVDFDPMHE